MSYNNTHKITQMVRSKKCQNYESIMRECKIRCNEGTKRNRQKQFTAQGEKYIQEPNSNSCYYLLDHSSESTIQNNIENSNQRSAQTEATMYKKKQCVAWEKGECVKWKTKYQIKIFPIILRDTCLYLFKLQKYNLLV